MGEDNKYIVKTELLEVKTLENQLKYEKLNENLY